MTKRERKKYYEAALLYILRKGNSNINGICVILWDVTPGYINNIDEVQKHFVELMKFRPANKKKSESWFPFNKTGNKKRVSILKKCIKETSKT